MKTYKKYIVGAAVLSVAVLTGCKDKMRELNTNPDLISSALPEYQFLGATKNWGWFSNGWARDRAGNIGATMQVSLYNGSSGSYVNPTDWSGGNMSYFGKIYSRYYSAGKRLNSLCDYIDEQLDATERPRYQDIRAIARVLQMHEAWTIFTNYGAMVFDEAFKIREGITFPTYNVYSKESGIYKQLDDSVKMCIAQLSSPIREDAVALGAHDGFYGFTYTTKETGGATWAVNTPEKERERWLKFATTLRLKMAVSVRNVDPEFYQTVLGEVRQLVSSNPNALMSEVQDGCQFVLPDSWYDKNENNQLSFWYGMPVSYVHSMKLVNDPRLPLVANMNFCDTSLSTAYKFVASYYPDSLLTKNIYDEKTNTWTRKSWGDVLKMGNVFQGQTSNPANSGNSFGPGTLLKGLSLSITMRHPDWKNPDEYGISASEKEARIAHNATLKSAQMTNSFTGTTETAVYGTNKEPFTNGVVSMSFRIASGLQSRHYLMNTGGGGWAGPSWDYDNNSPAETEIKMVTKVLPYAEHCFLMALICNYDGGTIGSKDAEGWYNEGIRASMQETVEDAERVFVKICTNNSFPTVAGVNADADGSNKRLYKIDYTGADYTNYIAKPDVQFTGSQDDKTNKIMIQMWLANWQKPENTWFYYKLTGYPHTVKYEWETPNEAAMPQQLGFEQPYLSTGEQMVFPRRVTTPQPQVENMPNWYEMQSALEAQTNPSYAPHGWNDYSGRVFWDVIEPAGLY
ncbi:MAG: SusD/RagB family nutrient-binding outer membrane lipoprotein [Rikenellaceae bacterium]|nr:SusD/RagB family nutrient-binding outer membrane lipoprotein [Rikenellaceae bacterium]